MKAQLFYTFSVCAVLLSVILIFVRNPIVSGLCLVGTFFFVSGIFVLLSAPFLSVLQILIYAGAIMVLFLYVMMLLNVRTERAVSYKKLFLKWIHLSLIPILYYVFRPLISLPTFSDADIPEYFGSVFHVGEMLLGPFVFVFEIVSVILLAAMVGVVVLTKKQQEEP